MSDKQVAEQAFDRVEQNLRDLSRWMYENPELGCEEFEASARISTFFGDNGFDLTYPSHGLDTAFEATVGTTGPRVVICCEDDALPEVGHPCGRNVIATSAVGAGVALAPLAEELGIRVTVLGTPAEATGRAYERIVSGAGHDACYLASRGPAAIVSVPCRDGLSHNEAESIEPGQAEVGAEVLLHAALSLAS
ncbi:MAG: hypothetical protein CL466_09565 [Acidimicrobiaceae bacterium]|nr:hypothetical protein [Acidimicrobiaceae bacterium]